MLNAMIWGASGGIGRALIEKMSGPDWRLFAAARDIENIPAGVHERYRFEAGDLAAIRDVAIDLAHQTDGIDLWVYAAGELQAGLLHKMSLESWSAVVDSNLNGAFLTIGHTVHLLREGAQAVFIGAYVDHLLLPKMGAYAAAKAGLEPLIAVLQKENRRVNFTLIKPGAVATRFWENAPFKMPANAKAPGLIADAIIAQFQKGGRGTVEL